MGEIKRNAQARIAIVNQHHADQLDLQMTPLEFMRSKFPGDGSQSHQLTLRSHLDRMGVPTARQVGAWEAGWSGPHPCGIAPRLPPPTRGLLASLR